MKKKAEIVVKIPEVPEVKIPRLQILCGQCGSLNVRRDAWAMWNVETQKWELTDVLDQGYCDDCEGEAHLIEADLDSLR